MKGIATRPDRYFVNSDFSNCRLRGQIYFKNLHINHRESLLVMAQKFISTWITFSIAEVVQKFISKWLKFLLTFTHTHPYKSGDLVLNALKINQVLRGQGYKGYN